jgi:hypothetical protein
LCGPRRCPATARPAASSATAVSSRGSALTLLEVFCKMRFVLICESEVWQWPTSPERSKRPLRSSTE